MAERVIGDRGQEEGRDTGEIRQEITLREPGRGEALVEIEDVETLVTAEIERTARRPPPRARLFAPIKSRMREPDSGRALAGGRGRVAARDDSR